MTIEAVELRELTTFVAVAEARGFRKAAERLAIEQSAVSRRVWSLEDRLGVSLLERSRGGARTTVAGQRLLKDMRVILAQLTSTLIAVQSAGYAAEGLIKIGVVASISSGFAKSLIRRFRHEHPTVALEFTEGDPRDHLGEVQGRELDLAIVTGSRSVIGCQTEQLWREPILVAMQSIDPRSSKPQVELNALNAETFIVSRAAPGPEIHDWLIRKLGRLGFRPSIEVQGLTREGLMTLVELGFGITLVSGAEADVGYPGVRFVPLAGEG